MFKVNTWTHMHTTGVRDVGKGNLNRLKTKIRILKKVWGVQDKGSVFLEARHYLKSLISSNNPSSL